MSWLAPSLPASFDEAKRLSALHALPERFPVGLELSCTHHGSATGGWVTGVARVIHMGRSTSTSEIVLNDERGRRTCTARLTCLHRDTQPEPRAAFLRPTVPVAIEDVR